MGITWIGEIISAYCNVDWLFFILNLPNIFQGVFVFLIFGLKKTHFRKSQRQLQRGRSSRETSSTGTSGNSVNRHPEGLREGRSVSFLPNPEIVTFDLNRKIPK